MKIRELFRNPIERRIEEVIKVDLGDERTVAYEISEYVVTDHIRRELKRVLEAYVETIRSPAETTNVWISGFFGSGKSSFAKILGYLLENPVIEGKPAAERFFERVSDEELRALLSTIYARAPSLAVFVDLSSGRNVMREGESIVLPLYRALLERLDYSRDIGLAELEFQLEGDGELAAFEEAFARVVGKRGAWRERRNVGLARNEASHALCLLRPETYPSPDSWARSVREPEVTANSFVERALQLVARRGKGAVRLVFVVDEVGQYVARSVSRILDLEGLAHAVQKQRGRILLVVTSQEKLEDVVESLEGRQIELARLRDRFPLTVDLIPSDIEEVVARRVLDKRAEAARELRRVFQANRHRLLANVHLDSPVRQREFSEEEFVRLYPLLPYQVQLFIDAVSAHRARGGGGPMLGGSNRTIIKLAQQMVVDPRTGLAEAEVGALATAAMAYDLLEAILPTSWRSEVEKVEERHPKGIEGAVVKAVAVLSGVKALKLDVANLAAVLHPAVEHESLREEVAQALRTLTEEEVLRASEDGYKLQSPEEKDWERERRGIDMKPAQWGVIRRRLLRDLFEGLVVEQLRSFRVEVRVGRDRILEGELTCILEEREEATFEELRERSRTEAQSLFWAYEVSDETMECAREFHRSEEMLKRHQGAARSAAETTLMGEERARLERTERRLRELLAADLLRGRMFFAGADEEPSGNDVKQALAGALGSKVERIFPRLHEFAAPVSVQDALGLLRADDLSGLSRHLYEEGIGILRTTPDGVEIARDREPLATVLGIVVDRASYGEEATGRYLEEHFSRPPFGATADVLRVLLAALLRAGLVEVRYQGARIANPRDPRLEKVFGVLPGFRAATFTPQRLVDPDMRARVATRLQELTGERPPSIAADQLAASLRRAFLPDGATISRVVATLSALGLEVPELFNRVGSVIREMEHMPDDEVIKLADEAWAGLRDARSIARNLVEVLDAGGLALLREAREIARRGAEDLGAEAEARIERIRDLVADPLRLADSLPVLRGLVEEHKAAVREAWEQARGELCAKVGRAQAHIRERFAGRVKPEALEEAIRPLAELVPHEGPGSGSSLEILRSRVQSFETLVDGVIGGLEELVAAGEVMRVRVRDLYDGVISSQEELEVLLERIRRAADEALSQGKRFLLM